jgi:hypothetical protein
VRLVFFIERLELQRPERVWSGAMTVDIPESMRKFVAGAFLDYASALAVLPSPSKAHSEEILRVMEWLRARALDEH